MRESPVKLGTIWMDVGKGCRARKKMIIILIIESMTANVLMHLQRNHRPPGALAWRRLRRHHGMLSFGFLPRARRQAQVRQMRAGRSRDARRPSHLGLSTPGEQRRRRLGDF